MNKYERYGKQVSDRENEQTNPSYPLASIWWINKQANKSILSTSIYAMDKCISMGPSYSTSIYVMDKWIKEKEKENLGYLVS